MYWSADLGRCGGSELAYTAGCTYRMLLSAVFNVVTTNLQHENSAMEVWWNGHLFNRGIENHSKARQSNMLSSVTSRLRNSRAQAAQTAHRGASPTPPPSQSAGHSGSGGDSVTLSREAQELAVFVPISPNGGGCDSADWRCLEKVPQA